MKKKIYFVYDEDRGATIGYYHLKDDKQLTATSLCAPEDRKFKSSLTGGVIAEARLHIAALKHERDNVLKPQLQILEHLYSTMRLSKQFNENSYENKRLQREIRFIKKQLEITNKDIAEERQNLSEYLENKEKAHNKLM